MEKYIIDRFEEEYAVLEKEDGTTENVARELIPDASEGDVVIEENGKYSIDKNETEERKRRIGEKMKKLFGDK